MNNVLLGKTLKAMYKLSGKTLSQLSDETGLTIDTINNLFYARVQKPGLAGIQTLVNAMGFSLQQMLTFLDAHPDLTENQDITELFNTYISTAADAEIPASPAKSPVSAAKGSLSAEIELVSEAQEKQFDRFRTTYQQYVDQLKEQHSQQIEQMQAYNRQMEQHFDHSTAELRALHTQEIDRLEKTNARLRSAVKALVTVAVIENALFLLLMILDMIDRGIGWMR